MVCTDIQVFCRNGRRLLPDNESDIRMLLAETESLVRISCSDEIVRLDAEFDLLGDAFISVVDKAVGKAHYFDNGSGSEKPVELMINVCPAGKMMCYDKEAAIEIIMHFCNTGDLHPEYTWTEVKV